MTVSHKNPASFRRLTFAFLSLALCVFAWGLQYKLSLYDPPQATSHRMPHAKLLSRDQWSTTPDDRQSTREKVSPHVLPEQLYLAFCLSLLTLRRNNSVFALQGQREVERPWLKCLPASLNAFFFRPPPPSLA